MSAADGRPRESGVSARRKRKGDCERPEKEARGATQTQPRKGRPCYVSGIEVYDRLARKLNPGVGVGQSEKRVEKVARGVAVN